MNYFQKERKKKERQKERKKKERQKERKKKDRKNEKKKVTLRDIGLQQCQNQKYNLFGI